MKSLGLFSQLLTLGLAVAIAFLYTVPALETAGLTQDQIDEYKTQQNRIERVNADLASHVATIESISPQNIERLTTYIPNSIDAIAVMRDIELIAGSVGVSLKSIESSDAQGEQVSDQNEEEQAARALVSESFSVTIDSTYDQIKTFLSALATNEYPLEIQELSVTPLEGGFVTVDIELRTYAASNEVELEDEVIQ